MNISNVFGSYLGGCDVVATAHNWLRIASYKTEQLIYQNLLTMQLTKEIRENKSVCIMLAR